MNEYKFKVEEECSGQRLDKYVYLKFDDKFSRTFIQNLIEKGLIKVDSEHSKSHYKVKQGQVIKVKVLQSKKYSFKPVNYKLDVVYEDKDIIVINKPAGLSVHPACKYSKNEKSEITLVNALLYHYGKLSRYGGELKPGIIHRLDKETSGIMVVAKTDYAHRKIAAQFKKRKVKKSYIAVVSGNISNKSAAVDLPIGRLPNRKIHMGISYVGGKRAYTEYKVLKNFSDYAVLKVNPETGRTHQIRVHLSYVGHPVLGDKKYGNDNAGSVGRLALHAYELSFTHPVTGKRLTFKASLPDDMKKFIPSEILKDDTKW